MILSKFPGKYSLHMEYPLGTVRYSKDIDEVFKSASVIKLPIFLYGFQHAKDLDELVEVLPEDIVDGSGVLQTIVTQSRWLSVRDLQALMVVVSDNTATNLLIKRYGIKRLNRYFQHIGMTKSILGREMRDQIAISEGRDNFVCGRDMVACLRKIASSAALHDMLYILDKQQFKDKVPAGAKNEHIVFFNKSGELENIEHDVGFFVHKGQIGLYCGLTEGSNHLGKALLQEFGHKFNEL